jgi:hypothetical protein
MPHVPKPRTGKTQRISVPVAVEDLEALREMARKRERSLSWLAAQAIRAYVAEVRKAVRPPRENESPEQR